jgi:hypothetical protein
MKKRYLRAVLLILGIAGIVAYSLYPVEKKIECLEKNSVEDFYTYGNSASGANFVEIEPFAFKCGLLSESGHCGIGFSFGSQKKNWNLNDSLVLVMQSSANFKELIVELLTFDPDHTESSNRSSMKPVLKELELNPNQKRYSIAMEHFYTPDYWFEQQKARNTHNPKRFSAVMGMEIFSGWKNPAGKSLELKIESVCTEGYSNASFVILVIYLGILIAIGVGVRIKSH